MMLLGAWSAVAPARMTALADRFSTTKGMWFAAAIRLVIGATLWFAAPQSRAPLMLQVFGVIAIVAAVVIPLMGVDRFKAMLGWWKKLSTPAMRAWSLLAVAFGVAILWALVPTAS